jgi:hypothetical protein
MTTSIRQQIITAVDTRLKTITTVNGYNTNLGNNIFEWRDAPLQESELPGAVYRDLQQTTVMAVGYHEHALALEILILLSGTEAATTIRKLIADVIKCVGTDRTWGTLAEDTLPVSDEEIAIEHAGKKIGGISLKFIIQYVTKPFDPYNSP